MKTSGIYKIQSAIKPEKIYIGSAMHINERRTNHLRRLKNNGHENGRLQNHYNKYGKDDLVFTIIEPCFPELLLIREQFYIDNLKPFFNICKIAGSVKGIRRSIESRKKQSDLYSGENHSMFGKHHTKESIELMSKSHKGHKAWNEGLKMSDEIRKKNSESHRGIKLSNETREKMSIAHSGEKNGMYGKSQSEESNRRNRESQVGKKRGPMSDEAKKKLSDAKKGVKKPPFSEEHRRKLSESLIGNKRTIGYRHTEGAKLKVSQSLIGNKRSLKRVELLKSLI